MALVEVARFLDLVEAQVVASALRSGGIFVFEQNAVLGRLDVNLVYAMGGVRIWVPEDEAADARAFIAESRRQPSTLEPLPAVEAAARTFVSVLLTFATGMVVPLRPRRPERLGDGHTAQDG
jgi:hypothetical protein